MSERFEETLIRHCAATLAGHKCGSLFSYRLGPGESMSENLRSLNGQLVGKGVQARLLKGCETGGLVYVFRPGKLAQRLAQADVGQFLREQGYACLTLPGALTTLARHIHCGQEFPHEIGVFLDYPLADVMGFIEHKGSGFSCLGCWKAYGNAEQAQRTFALYHKCQAVYLDCYSRGFDVVRLTVAA